MITYEDKLNRDLQWALKEGGRHFMNTSDVHDTLKRITKKLDELGVSYAHVGGMALFFHGHRRFTEDVDVLVTADGLKTIHEKLSGRGYVPLFTGSRNLRDTQTGVRIEFLVTGQYPGDGKAKAIAFPDPADVAVDIEGVRCLGVPTLIELKIVAGTTADRLQDLADVQQMIRILQLPLEFADKLHPSVQEAYRDLWRRTQRSPEQPQE